MAIYKLRKHGNVEYYCDQCGCKANSRAYFNVHKKWRHEGGTHTSNQCDYKASHPSCLTNHV